MKNCCSTSKCITRLYASISQTKLEKLEKIKNIEHLRHELEVMKNMQQHTAGSH